jgi:glucan 1,3-beta-glucosidase
LTTDDGIQTPSALYPSALPDNDIEPPRSSVLSPDADTPRASYGFVASAQNSAPLLDPYEKSEDVAALGIDPRNSRRRALWKRPVFWLFALAALVVVVLAVILPIYFKVIKPHSKNDATTGSGSGPNPESPTGATSGGNGSVIVTTNGSFTYINPYGGFCERHTKHCIIYVSNAAYHRGL